MADQSLNGTNPLPRLTSVTPNDLMYIEHSDMPFGVSVATLQAAIGGGSVGSGGTGITSYTTGDMLYASAPTTLAKLAAVAAGNVLISGTAPSWGKVGLASHVTGTLPVANGGTGQASYNTGDVLYASGSSALSRLAAVAAGAILISGGVGVAPAWSSSPTIGGALTVSGGIVGTATNNSAAAGNVGESVSSATAAINSVSLVTATAKTVTSISLTAGDWDVTAICYFVPAGTTTISELATSISTTNNALDTGVGNFTDDTKNGATIATAITYVMPPTRISLASTTTVYLVARATFGVSTMLSGGRISARRVR